MTDRLNAALAGRYAIEGEVGAGGMATVYLAHDTKHNRKVALKVLRPELAALIGAERFLKEIEVTANLQHPHILPLHDSGEADGFLFYVMPYVEGESLRDRLRRETQLAVDEAIEITRAVAGALDYAHRHGVIHRDIKPENVLLHDGNPVVADFGIALAVSHAGGTRLTETGLSVGTPHYMSPEQAMGDRELDARSDVYSLGAMLHEMLVGEPPFTGPTAQAIVAKVITEKPPLVTAARETVPRHVAAAVQKALAKLPADRYPSALTFGEALVRPAVADTESYPLLEHEAAATARRMPPLTMALAAALVLASGLALWGWLRSSPAPQMARFAIAFPEGQQRFDRGGTDIAISADGSFLIYGGPSPSAPAALYRRPIDQLEATLIPGTEAASAHAISPDGRFVAFLLFPNQLRVVSLEGGPPVTLTDSAGFSTPSWGPDQRLYYMLAGRLGAGLGRIPATGGTLERLTTPDSAAGERQHRWPDVLPNGKGVLFTIWRGLNASADVAVLDLESRAVRTLVRGTQARYATSGHLVYTREDGALLAARFDADKLELSGPSTPLIEGIVVEGSGAAEFSLSRTGTLVYLSGEAADRQLVWVDRSGAETPVGRDLRRDFAHPAISPDGSRLAVSVAEAGSRDIWIYQLAQGTLTRLTFEGTNNNYPFWSPDGRRVGYQSTRDRAAALYEVPADGSGPPRLLAAPPASRPIQEGLWHPDGRTLVYREGPGGTTLRDIYSLRPGQDSTPTTILGTQFDETAPTLSPDGRWMAYQSNESGRGEVYVRPFPGPGGRWQVSTAGGEEPRWARNGREIFYRRGRDLVSAAVQTVPTFSPGAERVLFSVGSYQSNPSHPAYDVSADGRRFLFVKELGGAQQQIVVLNWFEELNRRVGK